MRNKLKNNSIFLAIFLLLGIILGYFIMHLKLYIDDNVLIFPAVLKSFYFHFIQYNYDNGLFRPFALLYYYLIYSIYILSPQIAHLFPLTLHVLSGLLLFFALKRQKFAEVPSLLISLNFILFPFASEQFMWLSAGNEIIVNLFFMIQLLLIDHLKDFKKCLLLIFLIQFIAVFTFESIFFYFLPLSYLMICKYYLSESWPDKFKKTLFVSIILFIPNFFYLLSKLIFQPHVLAPRLTITTIGEMINNYQKLNRNIQNLFFNYSSIINFWLSNIRIGLTSIFENYFVAILFLILLIMLFKLYKQVDKISSKINPFVSLFWWLTFLASIPPLLVLKEFNFPFRALYLPTVMFIIALVSTISRYFRSLNITRILMMFLVILTITFLLMNVSIANKYKLQAEIDNSISVQIKNLLIKNNFSDNYPTYLLLKKMPHTMVYSNFLHADHIISCYNYWWCGQASLNMITGMVKDIGIKFNNDVYSGKKEISYRIFLLQRPLTILSFTNNEKCLRGKCFEVEKILKN